MAFPLFLELISSDKLWVIDILFFFNKKSNGLKSNNEFIRKYIFDLK